MTARDVSDFKRGIWMGYALAALMTSDMASTLAQAHADPAKVEVLREQARRLARSARRIYQEHCPGDPRKILEDVA